MRPARKLMGLDPVPWAPVPPPPDHWLVRLWRWLKNKLQKIGQ